MSPLGVLADLAAWAGENTAFNLGFIPEDKLEWKPAPTALSALEVVNHVAGAVISMQPVLGGAEWSPPQFTPATNLAEAQALLRQCSREYAEALRNVPAESLGREVTVYGRFTWPLGRVAGMPVLDLVHHHGQIAYIQTLLGDQESHFAGM